MARFLRECDLVKFTEFQPDVNSSWDMAHDVRAVIRRLRPEPQRTQESTENSVSEAAS